ncbi:hypothetical protein J7F03_28305 [Streptomyces sp. ISL-43]|uniref:hypothetical protein n=1 Tax=Streptomyces sp. ISL-43 TaxID=2819183 RepID=UPI001BED292A|nr:hypothetical protein [Streptomyces sp. ISL-43]MBT2450908.1 hypothetical protein [Streptomyces sp. ISL-43]
MLMIAVIAVLIAVIAAARRRWTQGGTGLPAQLNTAVGGGSKLCKVGFLSSTAHGTRRL